VEASDIPYHRLDNDERAISTVGPHLRKGPYPLLRVSCRGRACLKRPGAPSVIGILVLYILSPMVLPRLDPVAFSVGPLQVRWYALAYIVGMIAGWAIAIRIVENSKLWNGVPPLNRKLIDETCSWILLGALIGGRLGHVIFYDPNYFAQYPWRIVQLWQGGMSFHGGLAGALVAMIICSAVNHRIPLLSIMDVAATVAPIGIFLGRIANFINGELWGRVTTASFGVIFPWVDEYPRHPSQVYEAFFEGFLLFFVMLYAVYLLKTLRLPGVTAGIFAIWYSVARILVEFVREVNSTTGFIFKYFTMGQVLSVPLFLGGCFLICYAIIRDAKEKQKIRSTGHL